MSRQFILDYFLETAKADTDSVHEIHEISCHSISGLIVAAVIVVVIVAAIFLGRFIQNRKTGTKGKKNK